MLHPEDEILRIQVCYNLVWFVRRTYAEVAQEECKMTQRYKKIRFLTDENMQILLNYVVMGPIHDKGTLQTGTGKLTFQGKKHQLVIADVQLLSLFHLKSQTVMQKIIVAWLMAIAILTLSGGVIYGVIYYNLYPVITLPLSLFAVWEVSLLLIFTVSTFMLMFHFSSKGPLGSSWWVKVEYLDKQNTQQTAYFAYGSRNGWGGIWGRTHRMYANLQQEFPTQLRG